MKHQRLICCLLLVGWAPPVALAGSLPETFSLGRYVPADCWLYIHRVHNPEADFADRHWSTVIDAVINSGIDSEFKGLIASEIKGQSDREKFETFWTQMCESFRAVKWGDLTGREMVFAERFTNPMLVPDLFFLCRPEPDTAEANLAALRGIFKNLAELSDEVTFDANTVRGVDVWSLTISEAPFGWHLFRHDDVLGIVMGRRALWHTLGLVRGVQRRPGSIVDAPRFAQAMAEVPRPEDGLAYLDLKRLFADMQRGCESMAPAPAKVEVKAGVGDEKIVCRPDAAGVGSFLHVIVEAMKSCDIFEYIVSSDSTDGLQRIEENVVRLQFGYESKPLGRILGRPKPIERFEQYVPAEATAFNVSSGIDWLALYEEMISFVRTSCPGSEEALQWWDEWQVSIGFDIRKDLLSWLGSETVSYQLPGNVVTAFGPTPDWVTMMRVKDPTVAAERVDAGIKRLHALMEEHAGHGLIITPATTVKATGFQSVTHPMVIMMLHPVIGIQDDWLIVGSSQNAVNICLDRLAGRNNNVLENPRFRNEGVMADGPVCAASFQDLCGLGNELSQAMAMMQVPALSIPNEPEARPIKAIFATMAKLAPALARINFLRSTASVSTFDGQAWSTRTVTTYKESPPKPPMPPPTPTAMLESRFK